MQKLNFQGIRWGFLAQVGLLTLLFAYLILFNSTNYDFMDAGSMLGGAIVLTALSAVWFWRGRRAHTGLEWALVAYVAVYALTSFTSIDPRRSFGESLYLLASIFIFLAAAELAVSGIPRQRILLALAVAGGIYMIFLWMPVMVWYRDWLAASSGQLLPNINFRLPTPTVNSFLLNGLLFLGVAGLLTAQKTADRLLICVYIASVLGLNYLASARSAWLGDAAGLALVAIFWVISRKDQVRSAMGYLKLHKGLLVLVIAILVPLMAGVGIILYRQTLNPTHGPIADARTAFWGPAWEAFIKHPLIGQGPATYGEAYLASTSVPEYYFFPHGHSVPLNLLAEMGITGLLAFGVIYALAWKKLWQRLRGYPAEIRPMTWAAAGLLVCFSIQGFFDCYHVDPLGLWVGLIFLGTILATPRKTLTPFWRSRPWWLLLIITGTWLNFALFAPYAAGVQAAKRSDWRTAAAYLQSAAASDPYLAVNQQQSGIAQAMLASSGDKATLDQAITAFEQATRLDPAWMLNHLDLGALYLKRGDPEDDQKALSQFSDATRAAPGDSDTWLNLAAAQEQLGLEAAALQSYLKALDLNAAPAYFWRATSLRRQAWSTWQALHPVLPATIGPTLAALEAAAAADPTTGTHWLALGYAYLQADRLDQATDAWNKAGLAYLQPGPQEVELDWLGVELLAARGDLKGATSKGDGTLQAELFKGLYGAGASGTMTLYNQLAFRRPAMIAEFVPGVVTIPLTDEWAGRVAKLAGWHRALGENEQADAVQAQLVKAVPDFVGK